MRKLIFNSFILAATLLFSCLDNKVTYDYQGYTTFLYDQNTGYSQAVVSDQVKYTLTFQPATYLALSEFIRTNQNSRDSLDNFIGKYSDSYYFILTVEPFDSEYNLQELFYRESLDQIGFITNINNGINEYESKTTLRTKQFKRKPVLTYLESNANFNQKMNFSIVFLKNDEVKNDLLANEKFMVVFEDLVFPNEVLTFSFNSNITENYPEIKLR